MDAQILGIVKRFPKSFHIGMIPDMHANFAQSDEDAEAQAQIEDAHAKWHAESRVFKWSLAPVRSATSWSGLMASKFGNKA